MRSSRKTHGNLHAPAFQGRRLKGFFTSIRLQNAIVENVDLRGGEYFLLVFMSRYAADDGTRVFPSVATLAKDSRQDERSVRRQLRGLEAKGFIRRVGTSRHNTFNYSIVVSKCYPQGEGAAPPVESKTLAQSPSEGGFKSHRGGAKPPDSSSNSSVIHQNHDEEPHVKTAVGLSALADILKTLKTAKPLSREKP